MNKKLHPLISERLKKIKPRSSDEALHVAKEIVQEIALLGLMRAGFFKKAAFHGGTAFRIFYGLDRFSEDLDFCLQKPDKKYELSSFLEPIKNEIESWGLTVEVTERKKLDEVVKKAFLKETSLGALLSLQTPVDPNQKLLIKLEIDTNPSAGATFESKLCEFPTDFYVLCHDLNSMFAGKLHAVLKRKYIKGRDWYDLLVYLTRRVQPNYSLLKNALLQSDKDQDLPNQLDLQWLEKALKERIECVDLDKAKDDAAPFVTEGSSINLWSKKLFLDKLNNYATELRIKN